MGRPQVFRPLVWSFGLGGLGAAGTLALVLYMHEVLSLPDSWAVLLAGAGSTVVGLTMMLAGLMISAGE